MNARDLMIALTAVAIAAPATASTQRAPEATAKEAPKKQQTASNDQLYCIAYDDMVGSRVHQQECKTKAMGRPGDRRRSSGRALAGLRIAAVPDAGGESYP